MRSVNLGHVVGGRSIGLWSATELGREPLSDCSGARRGRGVVSAYGVRTALPAHPRTADLPLLVSCYRLLAALVAELPRARLVQGAGLGVPLGG